MLLGKMTIARCKKTGLILALFSFFVIFIALGTWQLKRLQWKQDLIQRVTQRVHAPVVVVPDPSRWPQLNAENDEYRHVKITGTYLYNLTTRVQAVTKFGRGFWLMTPLRCADGSVVLVNRGFVAEKGKVLRQVLAQDSAKNKISGLVTITGLMRMSESNGAFLRRNDPANDRWYSRDAQAIAAMHRLPWVAPYFIDAEAPEIISQQNKKGEYPAEYPIAGLTVIKFHNNHLVYAFTWYTLALMLAGYGYWLIKMRYWGTE